MTTIELKDDEMQLLKDALLCLKLQVYQKEKEALATMRTGKFLEKKSTIQRAEQALKEVEQSYSIIKRVANLLATKIE